MHDVVFRIVPRLPLAGTEYEIERSAEQVNSRRYQEHNLKLIIESQSKKYFFAAVINVPAIARLLANAAKKRKQTKISSLDVVKQLKSSHLAVD